MVMFHHSGDVSPRSLTISASQQLSRIACPDQVPFLFNRLRLTNPKFHMVHYLPFVFQMRIIAERSEACSRTVCWNRVGD